MAYSDSGHRFWHIDLTTRAGALGATGTAAIASFALAGLTMLGGLILAPWRAPGAGESISALVAIGLEILVFIMAGLRLRVGKGLVWGSVAAVLVGIEILFKLLTLTGIGGVVINGVLLVGLVNGLRGALALKRGLGFDDEDVSAFE